MQVLYYAPAAKVQGREIKNPPGKSPAGSCKIYFTALPRSPRAAGDIPPAKSDRPCISRAAPAAVPPCRRQSAGAARQSLSCRDPCRCNRRQSLGPIARKLRRRVERLVLDRKSTRL